MLQHILQLAESDIKYYDASDALAVAICHHYQTNSPVKATLKTTMLKKAKGWDDFVAQNPGRVKRK